MRWWNQQLVTLASTTLSLRVCSAVCVRRFVPISSMVAVWLWTTCGGMLAMFGFIFFWMTFSSCGLKKTNTTENKTVCKDRNKTDDVFQVFFFLSALYSQWNEFCWVFPEAQRRNTWLWALKPPTQCIRSTKSNMNTQTCQGVWYIKPQVSTSLGISSDASSHCHAATFNPWQINNPSMQPRIHPSGSTTSGYQRHWEAQRVDKYIAAPTNKLVPVGRPETNHCLMSHCEPSSGRITSESAKYHFS